MVLNSSLLTLQICHLLSKGFCWYPWFKCWTHLLGRGARYAWECHVVSYSQDQDRLPEWRTGQDGSTPWIPEYFLCQAPQLPGNFRTRSDSFSLCDPLCVVTKITNMNMNETNHHICTRARALVTLFSFFCNAWLIVYKTGCPSFVCWRYLSVLCTDLFDPLSTRTSLKIVPNFERTSCLCQFS